MIFIKKSYTQNDYNCLKNLFKAQGQFCQNIANSILFHSQPNIRMIIQLLIPKVQSNNRITSVFLFHSILITIIIPPLQPNIPLESKPSKKLLPHCHTRGIPS